MPRPAGTILRSSLTARVVTGGLLMAVLLWLVLDVVQSRSVGVLVNRQLSESLRGTARRDRLRFEAVAGLHLAQVALAARTEGVRNGVLALLEREGEAEVVNGDPAWLPQGAEWRLFPAVDFLAVADSEGRLRRVHAGRTKPSPTALAGLKPHIGAAGVEHPAVVNLDGTPMLVSSAAVVADDGTTLAWLVSASRLDSHFLQAGQGYFLDPGCIVAIAEAGSGRVIASSSPELLAPGADLHAFSTDYLLAGQDFPDYGPAAADLSFVSLMPRSRLAELAAPVLRLERSQRTVLALAMSGIILSTLIYLSWRLRRASGGVERLTQAVFGVEVAEAGGDELAGLEMRVQRLVCEVMRSREALAREAAERLALATEQMRVRAENQRLQLLQTVTDLLKVGVIRFTADGPVAENAMMGEFAAATGGLLPFIAARMQGEKDVRIGEGACERIFEITLARDVDPGLLLVEDVTERRRAEEEIASLALFPSQNPNAVLRIDAAGVVLKANGASTRLLETWNTGVGCQVPDRWRRVFAEVLDHGARREIQVAVGERTLALMAVPVPAPGAGYVNLYASDITARVAAERLLQAVNETLERRVLERTEALRAEIAGHVRARAELVAAKEQADVANRTKTEFLAAVSHELRTPLNAIIGFSEVMAAETHGPLGAPRYREYLADIASSGRHLLAVINDILDIAKIETGRVELDIDDVAVDELIGAAVRVVEARAAAGRLRLDSSIAAGLPTLRGDRRRLLQILTNLLSNAVKFTPEGGRVGVVARAENGMLVVSVADTGIGMSEEEIALAMQPFRQVDASLARRYEGTGLGLPLVHSFVHMHGGAIEVRSHKGAGTTVIVRLPISAAPCQERDQSLAVQR